MNVQLQCVYSVPLHERLRISRKAHHLRRTFIRLLLAITITAILVFGYRSFDDYLVAQAAFQNVHTACIATTVASIECSSQS